MLSYLQTNLPWLFRVFDPSPRFPTVAFPTCHPSHLSPLSLAPGVWVPSYVALPCTLRVWKKAWRRSVRWPCYLDLGRPFVLFGRTKIWTSLGNWKTVIQPLGCRKHLHFLGFSVVNPNVLSVYQLLKRKKKGVNSNTTTWGCEKWLHDYFIQHASVAKLNVCQLLKLFPFHSIAGPNKAGYLLWPETWHWSGDLAPWISRREWCMCFFPRVSPNTIPQ